MRRVHCEIDQCSRTHPWQELSESKANTSCLSLPLDAETKACVQTVLATGLATEYVVTSIVSLCNHLQLHRKIFFGVVEMFGVALRRTPKTGSYRNSFLGVVPSHVMSPTQTPFRLVMQSSS